MKQYLIFDVNSPLMQEHKIVNGKSNADVIKTYCKTAYPTKKPKASGSNYVQLSAQECRIEMVSL